jgi:hypothetical protein
MYYRIRYWNQVGFGAIADMTNLEFLNEKNATDTIPAVAIS